MKSQRDRSGERSESPTHVSDSAYGLCPSPSDLTAGSEKICLVYCVVRAGDVPEIAPPEGGDGCPVEFVIAGTLGAAVSWSTRASMPVEMDVERLMSYQGVVEAIHRQTTVLPVRYGCLVGGRAEVRELLLSGSEMFEAALSAVDGCEEYGIRVLLSAEKGPVPAAEDPPGRPSTDNKPSVAPLPPEQETGQTYLAARRAHYARKEAPDRLAAEVADRCRRAFRGMYIASTCESKVLSDQEGPGREPVVAGRDRDSQLVKNDAWAAMVSIHFLVDGKHQEAFLEAFRDLSGREQSPMLLTGPWPPYNFAQSGRHRGREA